MKWIRIRELSSTGMRICGSRDVFYWRGRLLSEMKRFGLMCGVDYASHYNERRLCGLFGGVQRAAAVKRVGIRGAVSAVLQRRILKNVRRMRILPDSPKMSRLEKGGTSCKNLIMIRSPTGRARGIRNSPASCGRHPCRRPRRR